MKKTLNEIKDRIYEAEGLLELLQLRGDKLDDLLPLITMRLDEARTALATLSTKNKLEPVKAAERVVEVVPEPTRLAAKQTVEEIEDEEPLYAVDNEETAPVDEPVTKATYVQETMIKEPAAPVAEEKPGKVVKPAFCLNDRFRFRRSIFGGSDADFNAAMDHIATLDSYEEAEEIFYGEMELNPEEPDVIDFMNIIKEYFGR